MTWRISFGNVVTIATFVLTVGVLYGEIKTKIQPVEELRKEMIEMKIELAKTQVELRGLQEAIKSLYRRR